MDDNFRGLAGGAMSEQAGRQSLMPTIKQRLEAAVKQAEDRLADVNRARALLDKHPELEELLNIMQRSPF